MLWIPLVLFWASGCLAQISFPGVCPALETVPNFDVARYMGVWYESAKYFARFQADGKCAKANYTLVENGTVLVENSDISSTTGTPSTISGLATPVGSLDVAKLTVVFPSSVPGRVANYWVIGTDYDNWAVVWSCHDLGVSSLRFVWVLTRRQHPSDSVLDQAYQVLDRNNIGRENLFATDQLNCPVA